MMHQSETEEEQDRMARIEKLAREISVCRTCVWANQYPGSNAMQEQIAEMGDHCENATADSYVHFPYTLSCSGFKEKVK